MTRFVRELGSVRPVYPRCTRRRGVVEAGTARSGQHADAEVARVTTTEPSRFG